MKERVKGRDYKGEIASCRHRGVCALAWPVSRVCNPMDCSPPGSSVHGISQARVLEWAASSSSRGSSQPRDRTHVFCISCISRWILYHCAKCSLPQFPGKPHSRHPSSCSLKQPSRRLLSTPDVIPVVRFLLLVRFSLCEVDGICFTPSLIFSHPCLEAVSETCIQTLLMDFCLPLGQKGYGSQKLLFARVALSKIYRRGS